MDDNITPSEDNSSSALPAPCRRDGWTPFARRLFLEVLAETGRVSRACDYAQLTAQSAYALRHRDILFAAGWDAACAMARAPLADALYEQAIDGVTETIRRDGAIVAERHRHDSRLSIAVLHRLDKRCDLAEERGARHLPLVRRWDEWLELIAKGDDAAALALLDNLDPQLAPDHQLHQLPLGENPTEAEPQDEDEHCFWPGDQGIWMTDFPPPADYDGNQLGKWGDYDYSRSCTDEETGLLDRVRGLDQAAARQQAECRRVERLADMLAELDEQSVLPPPAPSA